MSLSNDSVVLVLKALKGITANPDQCFTAYDVTKATRSLTDENIRHEDVREVIHTFYDQGFLNRYIRQDHSFYNPDSGQYATAKLFVPPNGDPNAYDPNEVQMVKDDSDGPQVLLQDSSGQALITVGTSKALPDSDAADTVIINNDPSDSDSASDSDSDGDMSASPSQPQFPPAAKPSTTPPRSRSLFDQIKDRLTQLPLKFFKDLD